MPKQDSAAWNNCYPPFFPDNPRRYAIYLVATEGSCTIQVIDHGNGTFSQRFTPNWHRDTLSPNDAPPGDGDPAAGDALRDKLG